MTATAELLVSLDAIVHETTRMLDVLDGAAGAGNAERRETKQSVLEIRNAAQALFDLLSEVRLEERRN